MLRRSIKYIDDIKFSTKYIFSFSIQNYKHIICMFMIYLSTYTPIFGIYIYFLLYWLSLGIISSIGIGSGLNTSILFLIPYTVQNIENIYLCLLTGYIWGLGSSIGEIPPYLLAKYKSEQFIEITTSTSCINKCNKIMINILERYGVLGIIFFASYPNMFFDLCGIICGIYQYPFYKFFIPTFIGKSFIRITIQTYLVKYSVYNDNSISVVLKKLFINKNEFSIFSYIFYVMVGLFIINIINITSKKYREIHRIV